MDLTLLHLRLSFPARLRIKLYKRLSRQLTHGISLVQALERYSRAQTHNPRLSRVCTYLLHQTAMGHSFAQSLTGLASAEEILLLQAGENDDLGHALLLCHELLKDRALINKTILRETNYPLFLLFLACGVFIVIGEVLVPQFTQLVPREAWKDGARFLLLFEGHGAFFGPGLLLGLLIFLCLLLGTLPRWTGKMRLLFERFLPWSLYREVVGAFFLYTLARLLAAGMQARDILLLLLKHSATTPYLRERILALDSAMAQGQNLGEAFLACGYAFPSQEMVEDLVLYAELPALEKELNMIAQEALKDCLERIEVEMKMVQILLLFMIMALILAVFFGLGSLQMELGTLNPL